VRGKRILRSSWARPAAKFLENCANSGKGYLRPPLRSSGIHRHLLLLGQGVEEMKGGKAIHVKPHEVKRTSKFGTMIAILFRPPWLKGRRQLCQTG
jgi:hypothetical protein